MDVEQFIRDSAARGMSRTATAAALGMSPTKFRTLLDVMPPLAWPGPGQSIDARRAAAASRGHFHPARRPNLAKAQEVQRDLHRRTVRGVRGTIPELIKHFGLSISSSSVRRRLREGYSPEDALFTPPAPPAFRRKKIAAQAPPRAPLSPWERVDLELSGAPAPMCM